MDAAQGATTGRAVRMAVNVICMLLMALYVWASLSDVIGYFGPERAMYPIGSEAAGSSYATPLHFVGRRIGALVLCVMGFGLPFFSSDQTRRTAIRLAVGSWVVIAVTLFKILGE